MDRQMSLQKKPSESPPPKIPSLSTLDKFRNTAIGLLLWVGVLIPLGLIVLTPLLLFHWGVVLLARLFRRDLIPLETTLLSSNTWSLPSLTSSQVWKIGGPLRASELREHFTQVFLSTEELREKYENLCCGLETWMGYCFKKRIMETFHLEKRIKELTLSEEELGKDFGGVDAFIGTWMGKSEEYEPATPHWDILLVHTPHLPYNILLFKIDHRLCDSGGLAHLVEKLSGVKTPKWNPVNNKTPPAADLSHKIGDMLAFPAVLVGYTWSLVWTRNLPLPKGRDLSKRKNSADEGKEAKKPTAQWLFSTSTFSLEEVKKVKRVTQSRFLSILATVESGALRRFILEKGARSVPQLPGVMWVPYLQRDGHEGLTNPLSLGLFKIPFREDFPGVVRLREGDKHLDFSEEIRFSEMISWMFFPIVKILPLKVYRVLYRFLWKVREMGMSHMLNPLVLSNNEPYYLLRKKVSHIYLSVFTPEDTKPFRYFISPTSNQGQLDVAVSATTDLFPTQSDLDIFTKVYLKEELHKLVASVELEV